MLRTKLNDKDLMITMFMILDNIFYINNLIKQMLLILKNKYYVIDIKNY